MRRPREPRESNSTRPPVYSESTLFTSSLAYETEPYVTVMATSVDLISYAAVDCLHMNNPTDSDDSHNFFYASERPPNERDSMAQTEKRVDGYLSTSLTLTSKRS